MGERGRLGVRVAAVAGPVVVAAAAALARAVLANTSATLVLVLVIVAVGVAGDRLAGVGRGSDEGRFLLTASSRVRRPTREQLLVAVTLAEQVAPANPDLNTPR
jgi:hypothetical protein